MSELFEEKEKVDTPVEVIKPKEVILPKETTFEKVGIYTNVSRVALCFNQKGANVNVTQKLIENQKKIDNLKKDVNYNKLNLAYKMLKKVRKALFLLEKDIKKHDDKTATEFKNVIEKLKNSGLYKPVMKEEKIGEKLRKVFTKEKTLVLKYSDLYPIDHTSEGLKAIEGNLLREYTEAIKVYEEREELLRSSVKFNTSVKATVTFLLQEAVEDLMKWAVKDAKKDKKSKIDIHNFKSEVLESSNYSILFYHLPATKVLRSYLDRKAKYDEDKKAFDEIRKTNRKNKISNRSIVKPFDEVERLDGHMKLVGKEGRKTSGKKHWEGLNLDKAGVNFSTYVIKIFDHVKTKLGASKMYLSTRAKEYVSNLMWQFLFKLSNMFDIHRLHRSSIINNEKGVNKLNAEKNIKYETVIEIFEILLCPVPETNTFETMQKAREIRMKLKSIKAQKK